MGNTNRVYNTINSTVSVYFFCLFFALESYAEKKHGDARKSLTSAAHN